MKITVPTMLFLALFAHEAQADTVVEDAMRGDFASCVIVQGTALASIQGKGANVTVIVNSAADQTYLAKANMAGKTVMLSCEGGHQKVWIVE